MERITKEVLMNLTNKDFSEWLTKLPHRELHNMKCLVEEELFERDRNKE